MQQRDQERKGSEMPRRAHSYRRISTRGKQLKGDGLNRQADFAQRLCERHGWILDDTLVFEDRGRSGFHGHHRRGKGQLLAFMEMVKHRRIPPGSVLIIENLDRLTREEMDVAHDLFKSILKSGIWIATEMPERIYTPDSLKTLLGTIEPLLHMYLAREQSQKLSERIADQWARRRERARAHGTPLGRFCPGWLTLSSQGEFQLIPLHVASVRKIYQLAIGGLGVYRIVTWLNNHREDHPPWGRSGRWLSQTVLSVLRTQTVLGRMQPMRCGEKDERIKEGGSVDNYFPSIIAEDVWRLAQIALDRRRRRSGRPGNQEANLFTGMVFDARSGNRLSMQRLVGRDNAGYRYLFDYQVNERGQCGCRISYRNFEDAVLRSLEQLRTVDVLPTDHNQSDSEIRIAELTKRQIALDHRIGEIQREIENPIHAELVASLAASWKKLSTEKSEAEKELARLKWESTTGRGEALAETQSLLELLRSCKDEERPELRRRTKATIPWLVDSIWVVVQPIHKQASIVHVQIHLKNGNPIYVRILPTVSQGKNRGKPLSGLQPWNLRDRDFREWNVSDIADEAVIVEEP